MGGCLAMKMVSQLKTVIHHSTNCISNRVTSVIMTTHTHTCLTAFFQGLPRSAGTRKVQPIWILVKQDTVSGSGISWAICKSAPCSRQITMPAPHHSVFYRTDALTAAQPTASKHWRQNLKLSVIMTNELLLSQTDTETVITTNNNSYYMQKIYGYYNKPVLAETPS